MYLAPSVVAALQRSPHVLAVILINIFFGWTLIGWIICWVIVFQDNKNAQRSHSWVPQAQYGTGALSPDGMFWWDGIAWRDTRVVAPPWAQRSPDGFWWWDGLRWRPTPPPAPPA